MFGAILRCKVCNKYTPDRCICSKAAKKQQEIEALRAEIDKITTMISRTHFHDTAKMLDKKRNKLYVALKILEK